LAAAFAWLLMLGAAPPLPPSLPTPAEATARVVACGLPAKAVRIEDAAELQEAIVRVAPIGPVSDDTLRCVARASLASFHYVFFEDALQPHYWSVYWALEQEASLVTARQWLAERGLLDTLPRPESGGDLAAYARRLEAFCGLKSGSMLDALGQDLVIMPKSLDPPPPDEGFTCLTNASQVAGVSMGFIGNEAETPPAKR
jgi:hypothetical protein